MLFDLSTSKNEENFILTFFKTSFSIFDIEKNQGSWQVLIKQYQVN